ncbi:substrate-binding domain-containing protein [Saccharospirillum salsuginis]|uniref:Formate dehydrogenase n=1 Tax=Saccharospirillum salsuginis TaxID=418750 RepID=A0A918NCB5_9GAMM|nr:substrate-binding domain-containing protein [Saccharospirillum salsuginis]GGX57367.1 formate dehydrogenase [Saccharospirillum salsuginis]
MHKKKLSITPSWVFRTETDELFDPVLFRLLKSIRDTGRLTVAAREAGVSYRHAWNLINRGADFFDLPLVRKRKGQGTELTPLGEVLLWSEQRIKARLGPQIDSMASELNIQLQQLFEGAHPVLRLHASHGYAVALLPRYPDRLELKLQYCNTREALAALNRGECDLASFHLPTDSALAEQTLNYYHDDLQAADLKVIRFVTRKQGLIVPRGNPKGIEGLKDLARPFSNQKLLFINRDRDSGTHRLFSMLLNEADMTSADLHNADQEEYTHTAVAAYVASGMADVGFGVEAAARQFDLDFIELASEHYLLIGHEERLRQATMTQLLDLMAAPDFIDAINELPGYAPDQCGEIVTLEKLLAADG